MITKDSKQQLVATFGKDDKDTGKPEVQIAILSARIADLTEHLKRHTKDHSTRQGLLRLVGKRRRLLNYLMNNEITRYRTVIAELNLRK